MNVPFDEIYAKEKKLVEDIVRAELKIKELEENLHNPAAMAKFDPANIDDDHPVFGNMYEESERS